MPDLSAAVRTGGPHSPAYTRELGAALAEIVRALNHATIGRADGLETPQDAERLAWSLRTAAEGTPPLLANITGFLDRLWAAGDLADSGGRHPGEQVAKASFRLGAAHQRAVELAAEMGRVASALSGLYLEGDDDE